MGGAVWTPEEKERLSVWWATDVSIADFAVHFPGRAPASIEKIGQKIGLPKRRIEREWKLEEDAEVRALWFEPGPLKTLCARVPGRSADAIKMRGKKLGLPTNRGALKRSRFSWVTKVINEELAKGVPLAVFELATLTKASEERINDLLARGKKANLYHVVSYVRRSGVGNWAGRWVLGAGKDAEKPKAVPKAAIARKTYAKKRRKAGQVNPFLAAAGMVQPPAGTTGRVYSQSMSLRDLGKEAA
jgi:hypothetical protein